MIDVSLCHVGCHQSVLRCVSFNSIWNGKCNEVDVLWYIFFFHEKVK